MARSPSLLLVGFLVLAALEVNTVVAQSGSDDMVMKEDEILGLFEVLGDLLEDPEWGQLHPQPCTETPWPGVQCEIGEEQEEGPLIFHVTKIHIGPDIVTPPCKKSAVLSKSLHKLPYLKTLSIFNCFVTSMVILSPVLFGNLTSLEHLALNSNPSLSGEIPSSLAQVQSLRVLSLSQNNLSGRVPFQLGGLKNLEQLDLSYNNLSGQIPQEIGGLKSLSILDLSWNGLEGEIPCSIGQLLLLQKIDLGSNRLLGMIPPDLGQLKRLVLFDLSHNFINGPLPDLISGLEQLQYLIVDHNPLNSGMPLFLGTLKSLRSIGLSGCGLIGPIPNSLSSLKNLTALALDNNSLTGTLPSSLGSLPNLDQLNVSHNQLSGEILLPIEFIERLGKRLDVRANKELCTSKNIYRESNISVNLETPFCNDTTIGNEDKNPCPEVKGNESCLDRKNPDEAMGLQPSGTHGKTSSKAPTCKDDYQKVLFHVLFVLSLLSSLL